MDKKNVIRAVIIDDERSGRLVLQRMLQIYCHDIEVVAVKDSAESGRQAIAQYHPDIVFLDIEMPFKSGFELLDGFEQRNFDVVFVSAFEQYRQQVKAYSPLGLLLKPFTLTQLQLTIEEYRKSINSNH